MTVFLTVTDREAIAFDRRSYVAIAEAWGINRKRVSTIKQRAGTARSQRETPRRQVKAEAPPVPVAMPDRYYRVDWEASL